MNIMSRLKNTQSPGPENKLTKKNILTFGGIGAGIVMAGLVLVTTVNLSSTEICGNGIDDNSNGEVDEAGCTCDAGFTPILVSGGGYSGNAESQQNIGVSNASNATGTPDNFYAMIYHDGDVLVLSLEHEIPAGSQYTIRWASKNWRTSYMMVSESSDYSNWYYNSTPSTSGTTINSVTLTAGRNIRYLRLDKYSFVNISGMTVHNGVDSRNSEDYRVYDVSYDLSSEEYTCDTDWDGDGIADSIDMDDDNDGIPDMIEDMGFDMQTCDKEPMRFRNPVRVSGSGLSEGAVFRFRSITTGVDALVTIADLQNATVNELDYVSSGYSNALQPVVEKVAGVQSGYADFLVRFVIAGTSTDTIINSLGGGALDIDGDNNESYEAVGFIDIDYLGINTVTDLAPSSNGEFEHQFTGPINTYDGITVNDPEVMVYFNERNTSSFLYRTYVNNRYSTDASERLFSLYFDQCVLNIFTNVTTVAENPPDTDNDGIPDTRDLDSDNDGIYDAVESGSGVSQSNGVVTGGVSSRGMPSQVDSDDDGNIDYSMVDTDNNGVLDYVSLDSDGDGVHDVLEAGFEDADGNGQLDGTSYSTFGLISGFASGYTTPDPGYTDPDSYGAYRGILPVEWLAIEVSQQGADAEVYWATSKEMNSDYFQIERSFDQQVFQPVGRLEAAGNSDIINEYYFTDEEVVNPDNSRIFYRLKQVDIDGSVEYSQVFQLKMQQVTLTAELSLYPNPATNVVNLEINGAGDRRVEVKIFSLSGQLMYQTNGAQNKFTINIEGWPADIYIAQISGLNEPLSQKFVKKDAI